MSREHEEILEFGDVDSRLAGGPLSAMTYSREIRHRGLNKRRLIKSRGREEFNRKVNDQIDRWAAEYARVVQRESGRDTAERLTTEAEDALRESDEILASALRAGPRKHPSRPAHSLFHEPEQTKGIEYNLTTREPLAYRPAARPRGPAPVYERPPLMPIDRLLPFLWRRSEAAALDAFDDASDDWEAGHRYADQEDSRRERTLEIEKRDWQTREERRLRYARWNRKDSSPIEHHTELILNASAYPDWIDDELDFDLRYSADSRTLVVEFQLPEQASTPTLRRVTYVQTKDELRENHISAREQNRLYGSVLCQIALRTMHELYTADEVDALASIVFNGWLEATDPATGHKADRYIMSIRTHRQEFLALNLAEVDAEACFRSLESRAGRKLAALEQVEPIERLNPVGP